MTSPKTSAQEAMRPFVCSFFSLFFRAGSSIRFLSHSVNCIVRLRGGPVVCRIYYVRMNAYLGRVSSSSSATRKISLR